MNQAPQVSKREDGYYQDLSSQWIVDLIAVSTDNVLLDLCAAPGGKATALAAKAKKIVACDVNEKRHKLIQENIKNLSIENVDQVVSDGRSAPFAPNGFDHVLVDAPCSGLGVLHRRADSRWRIKKGDVANLAALQIELLDSSVPLLKQGGTLTYSVCTVTNEETVDVAKTLESRWPNLIPQKMTHANWREFGNGLQILPQDCDTDGMTVFQWKLLNGVSNDLRTKDR
jgi:16S rRNA (cytosine967-C5)-methyltransferase